MYERVNDMTVYYEEHGRPDAPALVLLHGYTVTGRITWNEHLDALGAEYRLIVPDNRGHGLTDNPAGRSGMNHHQFTQMCRHSAIGWGLNAQRSADTAPEQWLR